jgi:CHAD domain-containing protein
MPITDPEIRRSRTSIFSLAGGSDFPPLLKLISQKFEVEESDSSQQDRTYYDTFDWRLHRNNLVFFSSGARFTLQRFNGKTVAEGPGRKRSRLFWQAVESEKLADLLKKYIDMRALAPVVEVSSSLNNFRIMNRDRKTVARLCLRSDQTGGQDSPLQEVVTIEEIRGYEQEFEAVIDCFARARCEAVKNRYLINRLLEESGRTPRDYGEKFRVKLDDDATVGNAFSKICLHLAEDMERNRAGVIDDIDSEFLHDFRIAVRRTRSILSIMRAVLPPQSQDYFQREFGWLGSVTGPLRDIDVYLLEKDDYLGLLPETLRPGMNVFFDQVERRRAGELKKLQLHLQSSRYNDLISDWRAFLGDPNSELHSGAGAGSCRHFSDRTIVKRFNSFIKRAEKIDHSSPDEALHKLRIRGKKFRYLLEFFRSFYDNKDVDLFLRHMKNLQDNLGTFNDLSVQQEMLNGELDKLRGKNLQTIRFGASLGGLIGILSEKHREVRAAFDSTYEAFAQPQVRSLILAMVKRPL